MNTTHYPFLTGFVIGILTSVCTYTIGTIHYGIHLAIVNLEWWIMGLSTLPALLLLVWKRSLAGCSRIRKLILSATAGTVFLVAGLTVLHYLKSITRFIYGLFPSSEVYVNMMGYPSKLLLLQSAIFLSAAVYGTLVLITRYSTRFHRE